MPGGLDQQAPGMARARLGDRSLATLLPACVLGGNQAEVAHQLSGAPKALEVADLGAEAEC